MKNYKYIGLFLLSLDLVSCDVNNKLDEIAAPVEAEVALNINGLDFSSYVAVGASFTAGFTDSALFIAAQENSFPNILANKFGVGDTFKQPLMSDNIGGLLLGGNVIAGPRLYFNGSGPAVLLGTPTTEVSNVLAGPFNNMGVPGAKSFHLLAPGYGSVANVALGLANPYFARMASSPTATVLADVVAQSPTFFTLSEIGGNDVLGFATSGGDGSNPITPTATFDFAFNTILSTLTANGAKGVVANLPYITSLPHFTTVPYNPIPVSVDLAAQLNGAYGAYNVGIQQAFAYLVAVTPMTQEMADAEISKRKISFSAGQNAVVIMDESLTDLTAINAGLVSMRQATANDLLVLTSSSFIGTLADPNNPASVNGVAVPLADKWVLTPQEQKAIKTATDAYNTTISEVATANPNIALVDFKSVLVKAACTGIDFDGYVMTTNLVTGGLISLDGVHLTARGYALMANKILEAMDAEFGTNFTTATNGLAKAAEYPTNYSVLLR